jgi:hypothetical protein
MCLHVNENAQHMKVHKWSTRREIGIYARVLPCSSENINSMSYSSIKRLERLNMPTVSPLLLLLLLFPDSGLLPAVRAVKVHVITNVTSPDYVYPELNPESQFYISSIQQKPSLGIAISGGGWRAAALGYGWLRAMHLVSI